MVLFRTLRSVTYDSPPTSTSQPLMASNNFKALNPTSIRNYTMVKPAGLMSNRYKIEEMPDLSGKVAVVTGGSRGIGEAAVSALVQKGCQGMFTFHIS